jgi:eukaryotic-like serine/threonine-protein kinase
MTSPRRIMNLSKVEKKLRQETKDWTATDPHFLRQRLKLIFAIGLAVSFAAFLMDHFVSHRYGDVSWSRFASYNELFFIGYGISFLVGFLLASFRPWSIQALHLIDYAVIAFNIFLLSCSAAFYSPGIPRIYGFALLLFVHAVFIPSRVWVQFLIGLTTVLSYPLGQFLAFRFLPEVQGLWVSQGGEGAYRAATISNASDVFFLSAISVLVTKTLYHFRSNLERAQRLGNYILKQQIGRGGMGVVYEASHAFLARPTAIKILTPQTEDIQTASARFEQEVKIVSSLTHPNTVTIFDYGHTDNNTFYYAMELLEGLDFQKLVESFGPQPANRVISLLTQVCGSLAEAHARGFVHRDIKPSNLFLTERGGIYDFVKVLDFGLAKEFRPELAGRETEITQAGVYIGTPRYTAPECIRGQFGVDNRTDIYMLGSVAYWLLTGHSPFESESGMEMIVDHLKTAPARPSKRCSAQILPEMEEIVLKCLMKSPDERYQTAGELSAALQAIPGLVPWTQRDSKKWWEGNFRASHPLENK